MTVTVEEKEIIPFSNGFEFLNWRGRNCDECSKYENESSVVENAGCELAFYIDLASVTDGAIPKLVADKFGCEIQNCFLTNCKKRI